MLKRKFWRSLVAALTLVALVSQGTWVLAGTTGGLNGTVLDENSAPVQNALVTVASPSQIAHASTDTGGKFNFLTLIPDTYTISVEKQGYESTSTAGITVIADQNASVNLATRRVLRTIGRVTSRASTDIVRPGITTDVYSVNATTAGLAAPLGGGGSFTQAYSAIAAVPGVFINPNQSGWNQAVIVRGTNFDTTGYEYDGVPVNRAFDNYAAHTATTLGQQELQVYTGGGPGGSSATGLGGFINQVIRTGTYPGFADMKGTLSGPAFSHTFQAEVGGSSPNRNFSYYLGFSGFNADARYGSQYNGADNPLYQAPLYTPGLANVVDGAAPLCSANSANPTYNAGGGGNCYAFAPGNFEQAAFITDREFVSNFHIGLPHKDGTKDDIQFLYTSSALDTWWPDSPNELIPYLNPAFGTTAIRYKDVYTFPNGTVFGQSATGLAAVPYFYPDSPKNRAFNSVIPGTARDGFENDASILKLQYQKNFGSNAYARVFGYTFYSDWLNTAAVSRSSPLGVVPVNISPDYELDTHTRGLEFQLADQINSKNLLQATFNYVTASVIRYNNKTMQYNNLTTFDATNLVDANGFCYGITGARVECQSSASKANANVKYGTLGNPTPYPATGAALAAGATWIVTHPGLTAPNSVVMPKFSSYSLTDIFHPTDKLNITAGLRFERFEYDLHSTNNPGTNFWTLATQREGCYNTTTFVATGFHLTCGAGSAHPDGTGGHVLYTNTYPLTYAPTVTEPRIGATYSLSADTVLRAAYGRYAQPPNSASIQYETLEPNIPGYFFPKFSGVGFFSPQHSVRPAVASNYDFSLEQHVPRTDLSFKVTPFIKSVQDELQDVYLDQVTQYVSSINAGTLRTSGVEFQITKGSFDRDGFAAQLSYTYTNSKVRYQNLGNSSVNAIDQVNAVIKNFNTFTQAGGGAPCYTQAGVGVACAGNPAAVVNPYYNIAAQPTLDRNGWYTPFLITPSLPEAIQVSYYTPHVLSLILNYKKDRLAVTPTLQMFAGQPYGNPLNSNGYDPTSGCTNQAASGIASAIAAGIGQRADWTTCGGFISIPNPENGNTFDGMGAFSEPTQIVGNLQISYDLSSKIKANLVFSNLINTCFGGTKAPWNVGGSKNCSYGLDPYFGTDGVGPNYNGTSPLDTSANGGSTPAYNLHTYTVNQNGIGPGVASPLNVYLNFQIKI